MGSGAMGRRLGVRWSEIDLINKTLKERRKADASRGVPEIYRKQSQQLRPSRASFSCRVCCKLFPLISNQLQVPFWTTQL